LTESPQPWYKIVTPREDLRDDKFFDALVDASTEEKRCVVGVLTRKKGLGF
jgi:hypothetical protein